MEQDQIKALKAVISGSAVKIAAHFGAQVSQCEAFQTTLASLIRKNASALIRKPIAFILDSSATDAAAKKFDPAAIGKAVAAGKAVIHLSWDHEFLRAESVSNLGLPRAAEISKSKSTFVMFLEGRVAHEIIGGVTVSQFDIQNPQAPLGQRGRYQRSIEEFQQILDDHNESRIKLEKGPRYWRDKAKRILLEGPDGTEGIFHQDLSWWLRENVSDHIDVYQEPSAHGLDKIDIVIVTTNGSRVIEVKWMGENEKKTKYGRAAINQGLYQLKQYLDHDDKYVWGYLVVYDGRDAAAHKTDSSFDATNKHTLCDDPAIIFLESDNPSQAAKAVAAAQEKKLRKDKESSK